MTLREKQSAFCHAIGRLIVWAYEQGYELTLADGSIDPVRKKVRLASGVIARNVRDLVHMETGLHYKRLAQDLNLFIGAEWIKDGGHPAWTEIGIHWESMDALARWGGRFSDANHFSFENDGKK